LAISERNISMVRVLIDAKASSEHLSKIGWDALFYLWSKEDCVYIDTHPRGSLAFLKLFSASAVKFDLSMRDIWGWNALERAASHGGADVVKSVLDLSEEPFADGVGLGNAVHTLVAQAIERHDFALFSVLLPAFGDVDTRLDKSWYAGWTLLEIAAYNGCDEILRALLKTGADEFILEGPYFPDLLNPRIQDEEDVNEDAWTTENCRAYISALMDFNRVRRVEDAEGGVVGSVDLYWNAIENDPD
jgi:ankyrin repeat protein